MSKEWPETTEEWEAQQSVLVSAAFLVAVASEQLLTQEQFTSVFARAIALAKRDAIPNEDPERVVEVLVMYFCKAAKIPLDVGLLMFDEQTGHDV